MALPAAFLDHLRTHGYHSRSNRHSDALGVAIVHDLVSACPQLARRARSGEAVYELNFNVHAKTAVWNTDLVIGRSSEAKPPASGSIRRAPPGLIDIAIEMKAIMTEHRKQIKNRKRDLEAHHANVHNYRDITIAGGLFLVNYALRFKSPLRDTITVHARDRNAMVQLVQHCINEMRNVTERERPGMVGLDAKCVVVIEMDNINLASTAFIERPPAPRVGDPINYDSFLQRMCEHYTNRFSD